MSSFDLLYDFIPKHFSIYFRCKDTKNIIIQIG